jgi:hypothetical protein
MRNESEGTVFRAPGVGTGSMKEERGSVKVPAWRGWTVTVVVEVDLRVGEEGGGVVAAVEGEEADSECGDVVVVVVVGSAIVTVDRSLLCNPRLVISGAQWRSGFCCKLLVRSIVS